MQCGYMNYLDNVLINSVSVEIRNNETYNLPRDTQNFLEFTKDLNS